MPVQSSFRPMAALILLATVLSAGVVPSILGGFVGQTIAEAASPAKLGDLERFRKIVIDARALLDKGDIAETKARMKDLETAWDEAEAGLKPRAATEWHVVDKAIDRALTAIRASPPDITNCKNTLDELVHVMDRGGGKT
ncbi:MAG: histidine kinase [Afipia felis]|nr:histidine kinase [Afipia felis]